jgi:hypothetical protein
MHWLVLNLLAPRDVEGWYCSTCLAHEKVNGTQPPRFVLFDRTVIFSKSRAK